MKNLICVKKFSNRIDANIAKGKLEAEQIKSVIASDDEGGMFPFPLGKEGVQLLVNADKLKLAQGILEQK